MWGRIAGWRWPPALTRVAVRTVWRADRRAAVVLLVAVTVRSALGFLQVVTLALVVNAVPAAVAAGWGSQSAGRLWSAVALLAGAAVGVALMGPLTAQVQERLRLRVNADVEDRLLTLTGAPEGIAHLEDSTTTTRSRWRGAPCSASCLGVSLTGCRRRTGVAWARCPPSPCCCRSDGGRRYRR